MRLPKRTLAIPFSLLDSPFLRSLLIPLTKKTTSPKSEDRRGYEMLRSSKTCLTESEGQDARLLELLFIFANDFSRERFGLHEVKSRATVTLAHHNEEDVPWWPYLRLALTAQKPCGSHCTAGCS